MLVVRLMGVLGLIEITLKKKEELGALAAALGSSILGFAALRAAATLTAPPMLAFVSRFPFRILLSLLISFPLSPQIKSPSGDPIFESSGVLSFVKLGDGVL